MKRILLSLACAAAFVAAAPAAAATVNLSGFSNGSRSVNVNPPSVVGASVSAGRYVGTLDGNSFYSFCIDLFSTLSFGSTYTNYAPVAAATYLGSAAKALDLGRLATGFLGSLVDTDTTAAFQLAVWEITYESGSSYSLSGGTFTGSGGTAAAAIALANGWLANLPGTSTWQTTVLDSPNHQDLVTFSQVPVPGALVFMLTGLLGLVGVARRKPA